MRSIAANAWTTASEAHQMKNRYIYIDPKTVELVLECAGIASKPWARLFVWIIGLAKPGDRLGKQATDELSRYLNDNCAGDVALSDVRTAQFTREQAAAVFDGRDIYVTRALNALKQFGLIRRIYKGKRGFASLFIIAPFPQQIYACSVSETTPTNKAYYVGEKTPTQDGEYPNKTAPIHQHSGSPEQAKRSHIQDIPILSNDSGADFPAIESAEKPLINLECSVCHRTSDWRIDESGFASCSCGNVVLMR